MDWDLSKNNHLLMSSGLHKVFISLDGISEKTQDVIRQGSEIKELLRKIESFIALRNDKFPDVKIGMRFTKQSINASEWNDYYNYWNSRLNIDSGDMVLCYDMYNHNGNVVSSDPKQSAVTTCPELTNRMTNKAQRDSLIVLRRSHSRDFRVRKCFYRRPFSSLQYWPFPGN